MLDSCEISAFAVREGRLVRCDDAGERNALVQVSRMDRLVAGKYDGIVSVAEFKTLGDTGVGTFDSLNGELVMLEGEVYRVRADGRIEMPEDADTVPFGNAWHFEPEGTLRVENANGFEEVCSLLGAAVGDECRDLFCIAKLTGTFPHMTVRSVRAQRQPYVPLERVLEHDEVRISLRDAAGDIVAIYCPDHAEGIAELGWHLHFVSHDRAVGGHVLDLDVERATVIWGTTDKLRVLS